jgi:hypothetical protein
MLKRKSGAWVLGIAVGIPSLLNFPIGAVIGIYTLWLLT